MARNGRSDPMKLSASVYRLKQRAKTLAREKNLPLDEVAAGECHASWSLLAARAAARSPARTLLGKLSPGDLLLIGARPGQGKTMLAVELALEAAKSGRAAFFFTLEYMEQDLHDLAESLGHEAAAALIGSVGFENSDDISAGLIVNRIEGAPPGTVAVIDYLQILDQKRDKPDLMDQVRSLKVHAQRAGHVLVFISQIDRSYDPACKPFPGLEDVRLPNPLDLGLFDRSCFLNGGQVLIGA